MYTAVIAADVTRQALQLCRIIFQGRPFAFNERLDGGYERYDAIRIEVLCTRRFGSDVYG